MSELPSKNWPSRLSPLQGYREMSLEAALVALTSVGNPRVTKHDTGWYCVLELFVTVPGAKFKVDSDFKNTTPSEAVHKVIERLAELYSKF
jgi:hypothetical protein